ncbi:O-succinylhomoserine sulfhydrylase [Sessilibacter corallicola]|uniref:O-succinylhomoserine sulfhydrylase n=1 Tax=Sessilibacter corallicola TaxID=2904075 RepID=UPI001E4975FA|nr:O-succinylhomoserine sulfhydrylase [Sessilibacter corallicola]MCE2026903.1 O-succinylhomoserine sulfhydrylase [Sessilibacter corallicola]
MASELDDFFANTDLDTIAVRAGQLRTHEGEHSEPIFTTSSYVFESAEAAAKRFSGEEAGNVYSRYTNPTVRVFEQRIAALEGAEAAVATASGMSAILTVCMALLKSGDHVICSRSVFGTTSVLFTKYMAKMGISVTFVNPLDYDLWQNSLTDSTKLLFVETPSNPLCDVVDIARLSEIAHSVSAKLVVDNCFCTPALQQPLKLGADIVVHSATKYLDGQGRCVGGAIAGNAEDMDEALAFVRTCGPTMSAFNAWVFAKGLETLRLRMDAHCSNAMALASWLEEQKQSASPKVEQVFYAGLPSHKSHELAKKQQRGFGGVLSFRVVGGREEAWRFIDATKIMSLTANLGDAKTTIVHPATTTHGRLSDDEKKEAGITENLIRISVGLESANDLISDLERGMAAL